MREDPLFTTWRIRCPSPSDARAVRQHLTTLLQPDRVIADEVRAFPDGAEEKTRQAHRLGDYFASIRPLADDPDEESFRLLFQRRPEAGRYWKDLMVRILSDIRQLSAGTTTALAYRGGEEERAQQAG